MKHTNAKTIAVVLTTAFSACSLLLRSEAVASSATVAPNTTNCINLEFEQDGVLPSSEGFTYTSTPAGVAETSVFSVSGGMLHLNTLGTQAAAYYQLPNAYDPSQDFSLEIRMKVFPETGIFGTDFEVSDNVTDFEFGVDASGIRLPPPPNSRPFFPFDPTDSFHTYTVISSAGTKVYQFFIDGLLVASNSVSGGDPSGRLLFGDGTLTGGDGRADIDYIRFCQSPSVCVPAPSGMVSWWPGDGNASDIQGSNHGTLQNGATFGIGMVGPAFSFDGVDDYVNVAANPSLHPSAITVDCWLKANDLNNPDSNGAPSIISSNLSDFDGYQLQLDGGNGRVVFVIGGNTTRTVYATAGPEIAVAQWYHIAVTYDGVGGTGSLKLYLNGVQKTFAVINCCGISEPSGPIFYSGDYPLNIGRRSQDGINKFAGLVDEVEIFNRALSADQIAAIFNAGSAGKCKNATAPQLTELGDAKMWLGLKNSDDVGTKFDLLAEVFKNGSPVGSGQLNAVPGGSSGFNNAVLRTIELAVSAPSDVHSGDTLSIRLSVRIAVGVPGHRSGTARLWFNDAAANSRFDATIGGVTSDYFLLDGLNLGNSAGPGPKKTVDVFVDRLVGGNPFKPFGTWSKTL